MKFLNETCPDCKVFIFDNFNSDHYKTMQKLLDLQKVKRFIVLTTKEGARGIDFKGQGVALVILAFTPASVSESVQAAGRGCRTLDSHCEWILICDDPIEMQPETFLEVLDSKDSENAVLMETHMKVAKMLHGVSVEVENNEE